MKSNKAPIKAIKKRIERRSNAMSFSDLKVKFGLINV